MEHLSLFDLRLATIVTLTAVRGRVDDDDDTGQGTRTGDEDSMSIYNKMMDY